MTNRPSDLPDFEVLGEGLYQTDAFHRNPIFAVRPPGHPSDRPALLVRSWEAAMALHGEPHIDAINPAWLGRLISGSISASLAPYHRIKRLPRAHWVAIGADGNHHSTPYDPLSGGGGPMPDQELHALIRGGLLSSLRSSLQGHSGAIGCEHSSGLDSNAILGALRHGLQVDAKRLHTFNNEGYGEDTLVAEFRQFHGLSQEQAHPWRPGWRDGGLCSDAELLETIGQLSAPPQLGDSNSALGGLVRAGGTLLFSGFGGDQGLSHNGANVPTDLVASGRWRCLVRWYGSRRLALRAVAGRSLGLASRRWAETRLNRMDPSQAKQDPYGWLAGLLTEEGRVRFGPHLRVDGPIESDCYLRLAESIRQRTLASWVVMRAEEETRMAAALGIRKEFPLLNEHLIASVRAQEPLCHAPRRDQGRLIARQAFAPFLPPLLCSDPSKHRVPTSQESHAVHGAWRQAVASLTTRLQTDHHPLLERWWDVQEACRQAVEALEVDELDGNSELLAMVSSGLETLQKVSLWLQWLEGERRASPSGLPVLKPRSTPKQP
jgi:hypothetical protein